MSKVSRSIYQKKSEECKRMREDLRIISMGSVNEIIDALFKWKKIFKEEEMINLAIKNAVKIFIEKNPDDPAVILIHKINKKLIKKP